MAETFLNAFGFARVTIVVATASRGGLRGPKRLGLILADALKSYGLFPVDLPPPIKRDAN